MSKQLSDNMTAERDCGYELVILGLFATICILFLMAIKLLREEITYERRASAHWHSEFSRADRAYRNLQEELELD